jgi:hypothetical protein
MRQSDTPHMEKCRRIGAVQRGTVSPLATPNERFKMPNYLTPDQVVLMLPDLSRGMLAQMRFRGVGPAYRKPSPKTVLYVKDEVVA